MTYTKIDENRVEETKMVTETISIIRLNSEIEMLTIELLRTTERLAQLKAKRDEINTVVSSVI